MANDPLGNWTEAVWNAIRSVVRVGVVGRANADGTTTITVEGRPHYIYVRTGATSTGGELLEAYNKGVPRLAGAPVSLIKWNRVWTVVGVDADSPAVTADTYSVAYHVHKRDNGLAQSVHDLDGMPSNVAGRAGALLRVNDSADGYYLADADNGGTGTVDSVNGQVGDVVLDADDIAETATNIWFTPAEETKLAGIEALADVTDAVNVGSSIHGATAKTTPVDADTMPLIDSAASNVLKKVTWANIKATLKTYFDTLYAPLTWFAIGTWTPTLTAATPGTLSTGYTVRTGRYTRIYNLVFFTFFIRTSLYVPGTASGETWITGLPVTPTTGDINVMAFTAVTANVNWPGTPIDTAAEVVAGFDIIRLFAAQDNAARQYVTPGMIAATTDINVTGFYWVAL